MPTASKTWTFTSNAQSWVATNNGSGNACAWSASNGHNDAGCIQNVTSGKNRSGTGFWELTDTWANIFGIPAGSVVTSVGGAAGDGHWWKCSTYTTGAASTEGPFQLRDSGAALIGTFTAGQAYSSTTTYANPAASAVTVPAANGLASTTIKLRLNGSVNTGGSTSANNTLSQDDVTLTVTYYQPVFEDSDDWWGNALQTVVAPIQAVALAGAMLTAQVAQNTANLDQSDESQTYPIFSNDPYGQVVWGDSFYRGGLYQPDPSDDIAYSGGGPTPTPEEDFWPNAPKQLIQTTSVSLWWIGDDILKNPTPAGNANPDEDYWGVPGQSPPPDLWFENVFLPFPLGHGGDTVVLASEDYPYNAPIFNARHLRPIQQFGLHQDDPSGLRGQPDEDFWQNPVKPVAASLLYPQQSSFDEQIPAGSLFGQYDEDFWDNPLKKCERQLRLFRQDYWEHDETELPAILSPVEDYWVNPIATIWQSFIRLDQANFDEQFSAASAHGQYDEDFWNNPVRPVPPSLIFPLYPQQWNFDIQEPASNLTILPEIDSWQNLVFPIAPSSFQKLPYLPDISDEIVAQPTTLGPDEDFWVNPVQPLPLTLRRFEQAAGDEQYPTGTLFGLPEELYWQNPVNPTIRQLRWPQQWQFSEEIPAGYLVVELEDSPWIKNYTLFDRPFIRLDQWKFEMDSPALSIPQTVVTGIIQDLFGGGIPGYVIFKLRNFDNTVPRIIGTTQIATKQIKVHADATGFFSVLIWGNDKINPAGTFYEVTVEDQYHKKIASYNFNITGATFDLTSAVPL